MRRVNHQLRQLVGGAVRTERMRADGPMEVYCRKVVRLAKCLEGSEEASDGGCEAGERVMRRRAGVDG